VGAIDVAQGVDQNNGRSPEAQVLQLKMWPYVAFQKLDKYEIAIDLDKKAFGTR
jgi:hypothetical protein